MKNVILIVLFLSLAFNTGCSTVRQDPVALQHDFWKEKERKIGTIMTSVPEPNLEFPGASCLLCIATAKAAHTSLSKHVNSLSQEDLPVLHLLLAERLREEGMQVSILDETLDLKALPKHKSSVPNAVRKDFSAYRDRDGLTHLLVVDIKKIGLMRSYSAYVPTSDPKAVFVGETYLVDLSNNIYDWYLPLEIYKSAGTSWKEPPSFPALTDAYYRTLEIAKDQISSSLLE